MLSRTTAFALVGGTLPARLFSRTFFSDLAQLMSADGVLVLNYFGRAGANLRALACALQAAGFEHLRLFQEAVQTGALPASEDRSSRMSVAPVHVLHTGSRDVD